jgi:hypothetical protein
MNTQGIPMKKLSKREIAEAMKTMPIERILLGANNPANLKLTKKQKEFAEAAVSTGNKTEAYRRAYNSKGKRTTAAAEANKVSKNPNVATYILALEASKAAEEYLLPARLRSMAIHKLSSMALNDGLKPSEQLRALELVGKMSEVSLFSERREIVHSLDSGSLKSKLMEAVQLAIENSKSLRHATKRDAQQLLNELNEPIDIEAGDIKELEKAASSEGDGLENEDIPTPHTPIPPFLPDAMAGHMHSIPDNQSPKIAGEGVQNVSHETIDPLHETPPLSNPEQKG